MTHFQMLAVIKTMGKCYLLSFGELVFKLNINLFILGFPSFIFCSKFDQFLDLNLK